VPLREHIKVCCENVEGDEKGRKKIPLENENKKKKSLIMTFRISSAPLSNFDLQIEVCIHIEFPSSIWVIARMRKKNRARFNDLSFSSANKANESGSSNAVESDQHNETANIKNER
jgi:hypothetical protein